MTQRTSDPLRDCSKCGERLGLTWRMNLKGDFVCARCAEQPPSNPPLCAHGDKYLYHEPEGWICYRCEVDALRTIRAMLMDHMRAADETPACRYCAEGLSLFNGYHLNPGADPSGQNWIKCTAHVASECSCPEMQEPNCPAAPR